MHQLPQPTTSNFNRDDKNGNPKKWTITGNVTEKGFRLKTFVDWLNNGINYAKEVYAYMLSLNGKGNLFNYAGENNAGLNSAQLYVKAPGSRTSIHPENSVVASFNHNIGPGDCIWYCVPLSRSLINYSNVLCET
ncbi:hypothetical protein CRE_15744 [Caenorhabditis remanei]|uniref:JmjC domain-containing protein n=1 Tax=Caenorhabditis remanei TaxID=31234 RepID=E3NHD9_CAERE|nr:hypothetical protein CRE_15744 [Caenorhabditis remanei]